MLDITIPDVKASATLLPVNSFRGNILCKVNKGHIQPTLPRLLDTLTGEEAHLTAPRSREGISLDPMNFMRLACSTQSLRVPIFCSWQWTQIFIPLPRHKYIPELILPMCSDHYDQVGKGNRVELIVHGFSSFLPEQTRGADRGALADLRIVAAGGEFAPAFQQSNDFPPR